MKTIVQILAGLMLLVTVTGCASTKAYFVDRGHDALDIVNVGVEWKGIGASVAVGPIQTGLMLSGTDGYGMIGRDIGKYEFVDAQFVILGGKSVEVIPADEPWEQWQHKGYETDQILFVSQPYSFFTRRVNPENFIGLCELHLACGPGIRAGVNFLQILDFMLSWFGMDIMDDDIEIKRAREKAKQEAERFVILPNHQCGQLFRAEWNYISSITVSISTMPNGVDASEPVIAAIQDKNNNTLVAVTNMVSKADGGWVRFEVPKPGPKVRQGEEYIVTLIGTGHGLFAWNLEWNQEGQGKAIEFNRPNRKQDFLVIVN